ncbi:MAG: hypothetical protein NZ824_00365 [Candidatus Thioglobus sp.]|nr:hypothetical protein [Candidatus Thioglobus sp.]
MIELNNLLKYTMGLVKLQNIMLIGFVYFLHNSSFAVGLDESMVLTADHSQSITIETPTTNKFEGHYQGPEVGSEHNISYTTWEIGSNNAITLNFSGESPEGDKTTNIPRFYKQRVNAKNQFIVDRYDYLDTGYSAKLFVIEGTERGVNHISSGTKYSQWPESYSTYATPEVLIDKANSSSPNGYWGAIMPSDSNYLSLQLTSKGVGNISMQSGIYTLHLTLNVTANEILNP